MGIFRAIPIVWPLTSRLRSITYSKGSSLIRMLRAWVNEAKKNATKPHHSEQVLLRQGSSRQRPLITPAKPPFSLLSHPDPRHPDYFFRRMHSYLSTYAYSTATTADLWSKLDMHRHNLTNDSSPVFGVEKTMSTWTDQEGFPVVIMTPLPDGSLHVRQERHLHAHCCRNASELPGQDSIWWIPFQFQVYTNATHDGTPVPHGPPRTVLLTERETVIQDVGHCNDASSGCEMRLVKANFHQTAFYRVQCKSDAIR